MLERDFQFIARSIFELSGYQADRGLHSASELQEWVLKPEAYFAYLQYKQFEHAVRSARRAEWLAIAALVATTVALVGNVIFAVS